MVEMIINILDVLGYAATIIVIFATIVTIYQWITGIWPALWRLGKGLSGRRIAIIAEGDSFISLKNTLIDSNIFKQRNIDQITLREIKKAEGYTMLLAHWGTISGNIDSLLAGKKDQTALIIYAPQEEGMIPSDALNKINQHRNVICANFRGRLLNDIVTSMITTSY